MIISSSELSSSTGAGRPRLLVDALVDGVVPAGRLSVAAVDDLVVALVVRRRVGGILKL